LPYRRGIISQGEDLVGETKALNRKLRQTKGAKVPHLYDFESEEELFHVESELTKADWSDQVLISARVAYQKFWGKVKWAEFQKHLDHDDRCIPTNMREWACGLCRCGKGMTMFCRCDSGKKQMSPTRIVFVNSHEAWFNRNLVYDLNLHVYVPKQNPEPAPDWRTLSWDS